MNTYWDLQSGLRAIWPQLPGLIAGKLHEFESELLKLLRQFEAAPTDRACLNRILGRFEQDYPAVYKSLLENEAKTKPRARGGGAGPSTSLATRPSVGRFLIVPVWFATDRKESGRGGVKTRFGADR